MLILEYPYIIIWNILKMFGEWIMIERKAYTALMRLAEQFPVIVMLNVSFIDRICCINCI